MLAASIKAQNNRLSTYNQIGWYNLFGIWKINSKWSIHTEYQWRRNNIITQSQQSLLRTGINYAPSAHLLLRAGYAWVETYFYGDIPINNFGEQFSEHRIYEMLQLSHTDGPFEFAHRFILEQRLVGKYNSVSSITEDQFSLLNRARYMFRLQHPIKKHIRPEKKPI